MKHAHIIKKPIAILLTLALLLTVAAPALDESDSSAPDRHVVATPAQAQGPADAAELEAFLDGLLEQQMAENHIAGAAGAVVKDGVLFFAKGYGYADVEKGVPVDPGQTLFARRASATS